MNETKRLLVTGVGGQIGFELVRSLQGLGHVVAVDRTTLDLADLDQIRTVVRDVRPALIVNSAAYTGVDQAEHDEVTAMRVNAIAPGVLAEEAKAQGAALIHYSTDYVFDGTKTSPYLETDTPAPQSVYGRSKLEGERAVAAVGGAAIVFRTSWVYGARGRNFLLTMLRLAAERPELKVVADQIGAPTWANTIAMMTAHVAAQAFVVNDVAAWWAARSGVYHLTAGGETSWHGFASVIVERALLASRPLVIPIPSSDYPTLAKRPANSCLSNDKLARTFGLAALDWRDALDLCLAGIRPG